MARYISSQTPITDTSELSLSMAMNWLPVGGMITRKACGMITRLRVLNGLMPSAREASHWPTGML
ncbi:hypothetical protein D3C85_1268880 [compost metagenome]